MTTSHAGGLSSPPSIAANGPLSYALIRAAKAHKARAAVLLREIGLYPGQELLLMHLWDRDDRTQAELVQALALDASTVTRMVVRLEEQGAVRRKRSSLDRRAVIVSLTPRGRKLCEELGRLWSELEALTVSGLSGRAQDALHRALLRVADGLAGPDA